MKTSVVKESRLQLGLEYFCKVDYLTSAFEKIKPQRFSLNPNR